MIRKICFILILLYCSTCFADRTDNFNRADSAVTINSPSDGGSNWVVYVALWGISSNQGYTVTSVAHAFALLDSGFSNITVQVTFPVTGNIGLAIRGVDNNNVFLWNALDVYRIQAGSFNNLGSCNAFASNGDILAVRMNASNQITTYKNGSLLCSGITDSFQSTATQGGIYTYTSTATRFEDFSIVCDSGCSGGASAPKRSLLGVGQ